MTNENINHAVKSWKYLLNVSFPSKLSSNLKQQLQENFAVATEASQLVMVYADTSNLAVH